MPLHLAVGVAILAAMLWRLAIRLRRGVPPPPAAEAPPLRWLAHAVHVGLYLDMIGAALVGLIVYFWAPALAGVHEALARVVLLALVGLHVAGALAHHFYWGDDVLVRIVTPAKE